MCAEEMHKFPYDRFLNQLRKEFRTNEEIVHDCHPYTASMTIIGTLLREDDLVYGKINEVIDSFCDSKTSSMDSMSSPPGPMKAHNVSNGHGHLPLASTAEGSELGRYSMCLYEHLTNRGEQICWDEVRLSVHPPSFKASASIQGLTFEGVASQKKKARHLAAKEACIALRIKVD